MKAIEVTKVRKRFKDVLAVNEVSLDLEAGDYVGLLGPNGAGKTTLVEMIEGIQIPDAGEIRLMGKTWQAGRSFLQRKIGLALQETRFLEKLTVLETLNLFGSFYRQGKKASHRVLEEIGLAEKSRSWVVNLSGGQKQRLALGVALIGEPEILLLDEPTIGLDPNARQEVWEILTRLKQRGTTLILTTHYMEEAESLCDRIVIMHQGRFLAQGTMNELLRHLGEGESLQFNVDPPPRDHPWEKISGVIRVAWDERAGRADLRVKNINEALPLIFQSAEQSGFRIQGLQYRRHNLNDVFIALTGSHLHE